MKHAAMIRGIFTPNLVPFREDGSINEQELRRLVSWLIGKGVTGLYPNGSTGEFIRLSFEERHRVIEVVMDETRGRVPVLAGAAEANLDLTLEACRRYADLGCAAVSVTGPYYFKVSQESIEEYFRELARRSPIDLILYNIPQFANEISLPILTRLALDCPRIVGVKDSSRDFPRFLQTLQAVKTQRPEFSCLIGCEEILLPALVMGGDGGTIATSGVVPELVMTLYQEFEAGHWDQARSIQFQLLPLISSMLSAPNFPDGFRAGLAARGFQLGAGRQPLAAQERENLDLLRIRIQTTLAEWGLGAETAPAAPERFGPSGIDPGEIAREVIRLLKTGG